MYFNPRSHEGSDDIYLVAPVVTVLFQSTLPRGERRRSGNKHKRWKYFNPRSHEGSDLLSQLCGLMQQNFNPRSHEGSDYDAAGIIQGYENFNPRSHEGSDISFAFCNTDLELFQSTLPRGERQLLMNIKLQDCYFNPRSHEGSDQYRRNNSGILGDFNPRSHEGSDIHLYKEVQTMEHFNPRSHEGSDDINQERRTGKDISIHAPTRGATHRRENRTHAGKYFNPRSHEGSDDC